MKKKLFLPRDMKLFFVITRDMNLFFYDPGYETIFDFYDLRYETIFCSAEIKFTIKVSLPEGGKIDPSPFRAFPLWHQIWEKPGKDGFELKPKV